ncbi:MAG: alpha/beta hydrolase [Opitutaceae bacterium]|nr:alpha/beta hydrolase [Opitutaceae bacterium]
MNLVRLLVLGGGLTAACCLPRASGEPPADLPWSSWTRHGVADREVSVSGYEVRFDRKSGVTDPYLSRPIAYGKSHFTLKIRYRTDGRLAPTLLIFLPAEVDVRPLAVFRLPASSEWRDFETDFVGHAARQASLELRLYPGTVEAGRMKPGGLAPLGHHAGWAEFSTLTWTREAKPVGELSRGPQAFSTSKVEFKQADKQPLYVHVDRPETPISPVAVIWFHGGGFIGGTPDSCRPQTTYLASRGILCVRPQYRLVQQGGDADVTLQDAADAMAWVRKDGPALGIDPHRFLIAGTSAGAVLGSVLSQRTPGCLGFIGLAGYYDSVTPGDGAALDPRSAFFGYGKDPAVWRRISAILQITRRPPPPAFLIHGLLDSTVDCQQSVAYARALEAAGGSVELVILPWLNHIPNLVADDVFERVERFVRERQNLP